MGSGPPLNKFQDQNVGRKRKIQWPKEEAAAARRKERQRRYEARKQKEKRKW
jgi:hypothetical protein